VFKRLCRASGFQAALVASAYGSPVAAASGLPHLFLFVTLFDHHDGDAL
jgi:hypothetical protein